MLKRTLALLGLAPAGHVARQDDEIRRSAERVKSLEDRLEKLRADAQMWKQRHDETSRELGARLESAAAAATNAAEHAQAEVARWKERADRVTAQADLLRARLAEAEQAAAAAREHLMATEVKLDLLEAAIQVLDARTRESALAATDSR
jgi:hypothetical protein